MPIPKNILSVPRPKNTVVIAYGKDKGLYAVRQRIGCRNDNGRHLPVNGPTVGHIVDGRFVPIDTALLETTDFNQKMTTDFNQYKCHRIQPISKMQ